ncbi:hypothetical protein QE152_g19003 [Popillia japonica]|uniref:Uncharacterized protein n=1 Tax=Popillia japonica TaxID=7064 RepID=A0AAW1L4K3_POPJA
MSKFSNKVRVEVHASIICGDGYKSTCGIILSMAAINGDFSTFEAGPVGCSTSSSIQFNTVFVQQRYYWCNPEKEELIEGGELSVKEVMEPKTKVFVQQRYYWCNPEKEELIEGGELSVKEVMEPNHKRLRVRVSLSFWRRTKCQRES